MFPLTVPSRVVAEKYRFGSVDAKFVHWNQKFGGLVVGEEVHVVEGKIANLCGVNRFMQEEKRKAFERIELIKNEIKEWDEDIESLAALEVRTTRSISFVPFLPYLQFSRYQFPY